MTREEAFEIVALFTQAYRNDSWSPERIDLWVQCLIDLDRDQTRLASLAWITTEKWPPTISEIRDQTVGQKAPVAEEAWLEVVKEIQRIGSWGHPQLSELAYKTAEALGGWAAICASENQVADRAHFLKIYEVFEGRRRREELLPEFLRSAERKQIDSEKRTLAVVESTKPELPESNPDGLRRLHGTMAEVLRKTDLEKEE